MRAIVTSTVTFGLVSVPVKVYAAASSNAVRFNLLTPDGKRRVKQQLIDPETNTEVPQNQTVKGYEFSKDQFVTFTSEELKDLESQDDSKVMSIKEFVDADSLSHLQVEKTYFLGPNKGGDKGYALLSKTLRTLDKVAIAQWTNRSKEHLVAIQAHEQGLILQQLFYATELRDFSQVEVAPIEVSEAEEQMAALLVQKMSNGRFDLSKYKDGYATRVEKAVEAKVQGNNITVVSTSDNTKTVLDLFSALKASVEGTKPEAKPKAVKTAKKTRKPRAKK